MDANGKWKNSKVRTTVRMITSQWFLYLAEDANGEERIELIKEAVKFLREEGDEARAEKYQGLVEKLETSLASK